MIKLFNHRETEKQRSVEKNKFSMSLRALFPLVVIFLCSSLHSQNKIIDSLKLALKNLPSGQSSANYDTTRCIILSKLAESASSGEDSKFNEELKNLAENNVRLFANNSYLHKFYSKHLANAIINIGGFAMQKGHPKEWK